MSALGYTGTGVTGVNCDTFAKKLRFFQSFIAQIKDKGQHDAWNEIYQKLAQWGKTHPEPYPAHVRAKVAQWWAFIEPTAADRHPLSVSRLLHLIINIPL